MISWSVELFEFEIRYGPCGPIKLQCLADFMFELQDMPITDDLWTLYVDGSSNKSERGAKIVLEGPHNLLIEQSLNLSLASNNQAEYEVLVIGLLLEKYMEARMVKCKSNS